MSIDSSQCRPPPILSVLVTSPPQPVPSAREGTHGAFTSSQARLYLLRARPPHLFSSPGHPCAHIFLYALPSNLWNLSWKRAWRHWTRWFSSARCMRMVWTPGNMVGIPRLTTIRTPGDVRRAELDRSQDRWPVVAGGGGTISPAPHWVAGRHGDTVSGSHHGEITRKVGWLRML